MPLGFPPPTVGKASGLPGESVLGTRLSVPSGLESIYEYNGIYLNNRAWADTYLVDSRSGFDDADIRDDREDNPQDHGETPFDSFYGGRTLTLSGRIRAFELHKLNDMHEALRHAFDDINSEMPLVLHSLNSPDGDSQISCKKNVPLQITDDHQEDGILYRPFLITMRASNPRFLSLFGAHESVALGVVDDFSVDELDNYLIPDGSGTLTVTAGQLGFTTIGNKRLIRNDIPFLSSDQEVIIEYTPDATFTSSIIRAEARILEDNDNYLHGQINSAGELVIRKMDDGVATLLAGPSAPIARSGGTPYWLRFRIEGGTATLSHYTSDPRLGVVVPTLEITHVLSGATADKFGTGRTGDMAFMVQPGSTSWTVDDVSFVPVNLSNSELMTLVNNGGFEATPIVEFAGPMNNAALINVASGEVLALDKPIAQEEEFTIDIAGLTMVDQDGINKFNSLSSQSDWPKLESGNNLMLFSAEDMAAYFADGAWQVPRVEIDYHHSWK